MNVNFERGLNVLFLELIKTNLALASAIVDNIPTDHLGMHLEYFLLAQGSGDPHIRGLAEKLAFKIPADQLDKVILVKYKKDSHIDIKILANKLLSPKTADARSEDQLQREANEFIDMHFS